MPGLMQDQPLNLNRFVWRAEKLFYDKEIVTYTVRVDDCMLFCGQRGLAWLQPFSHDLFLRFAPTKLKGHGRPRVGSRLSTGTGLFAPTSWLTCSTRSASLAVAASAPLAGTGARRAPCAVLDFTSLWGCI
jgi:hypothetical protein